MAHCRACEQLDRGVVRDLAVLDHAAMPVRGVFAEAHVGDEHEIRVALPERAQSLLDDPVRGIGARAFIVLLFRDPEQDH